MTNEPAIITACIEGEMYAQNAHRLALLAPLIQAATELAPAGFLLLLPAGYLDSEAKGPDVLWHHASKAVMAALQDAPAGSVVCLGLDSYNRWEQLAMGISAVDCIAFARQWQPGRGENLDAAINPWVPERGYPRTLDFAGRRFYLAVAHDTIGLRKRPVPRLDVDGVLNLLHYFPWASAGGSTGAAWARDGFAGAARTWDCPVFGAVVWEVIEERWPTAVRWNQGELPLRNWRYADNPLQAQAKRWLQVAHEGAMLAVYPLSSAFASPPVRRPGAALGLDEG